MATYEASIVILLQEPISMVSAVFVGEGHEKKAQEYVDRYLQGQAYDIQQS